MISGIAAHIPDEPKPSAVAVGSSDSSASDTPRTDRWEYEQECNYDVPWEDHCRELERENGRLLAALQECILFTAMAQPVTPTGKEDQKKALAVALSLLPNTEMCNEPKNGDAT